MAQLYTTKPYLVVATVTLFCRTANSIHPSFLAAWHCMVYCMLNAALLNKHVWNSVSGMCLSCKLLKGSHCTFQTQILLSLSVSYPGNSSFLSIAKNQAMVSHQQAQLTD